MKRILIVEDEPSIAMVLEDDLRREGYQTEAATDGDTAARRAIAERFDLILLDDLGAQVFRDWQREILTLLIDRRYRDNKQTLITSNLDLDGLAATLDARAASRIAEMCAVIRFDGKDFRVYGNVSVKF